MTPAIKHIQVEGSVRTCITDINVSRCYFQKEFKYARSLPQSPSPLPLKCNTSLPKQMRDSCLWSGRSIPQILNPTNNLWAWCVALPIYWLGGKRQYTVLVGLEQHVGLAQKLFPCSWSHLIHPPSASEQIKASATKAPQIYCNEHVSKGQTQPPLGRQGQQRLCHVTRELGRWARLKEQCLLIKSGF